MSNEDNTTSITWHIDVPPNTSVSVDMCNHDIETSIEPILKHDGILSNYQHHPHRVEWAGREVQIQDNTYEYVGLDAKEALCLLAWLEQERGTLEKLAKE